MVKPRKNIIGQRFGSLVVLEQVEDYVNPNSGEHYARYKCRCDCGNVIEVTQNNLGRSSTNCGCKRSDGHLKGIARPNRRKHCKYDLESEDYAIGYTLKGEPFWFDKEDYDKVKNYCWHYDDHGYVTALERGTRKRIFLHTLVKGVAPDGMVIDHKEHPRTPGHKIDNRKQNLEFKTHSQNNMNMHIPKRNTSGAKGVNLNKGGGWQARICVSGVRHYLGTFKEFADAVKARKEAEKKYYGRHNLDANNPQTERSN